MLTQIITVTLDDRLVTLDRAVGALRRRNLPVRSVAVGPADAPGLARLTIMMQSDSATAERLALHFRKIVGVQQAITFAIGDGLTRELALVKLRPPRDRYAELLDVVQLYAGAVVDDSPGETVVELTGPEAFVLSALRALERFDIVAVARSGAVALERSGERPAAPSPLPDEKAS